MKEYVISDKLKARFCADNKISMQLYIEPYFTNRIKLFGYEEKYNNFISMIRDNFQNNEEAYFELYNKTKDDIINHIKNSKAFVLLNSDDMNKYKCEFNIRQSDVYKLPNVGKTFISIDIRKANFSSIVHYGIEHNTPFCESEYNWTEFMSQFTSIEHIIDSKYIRQVVFGNCNPKRQVTYEKYLMSLLLKEMIEVNLITEKDVYSMCSDEIVLYTDNMNEDMIDKLFDFINNKDKTWLPLKIEKYKLGKIDNTSAFVKLIDNKEQESTLELKCVSPVDAPAIHRLISGSQLLDEDLYFLSDNRLAKFMDYPELKIRFE